MRNSALLLLLTLLLVLSIQTVNSEESNGDGGNTTTSSEEAVVRWQILTEVNFSSEIGRNPNLLLLVSVPWCGESRSLMKELANVVANEQERFGTLKLMLLYRNNERKLANSLGATEGITILYFHHSLSYKYGGRFRAQSILSSIKYVMSLLPEERQLKTLSTAKELRTFLNSADKALLLLEFCGWTPRLLTKDRNMTENVFGGSKETNGALLLEEKRKQKETGYHKMSCNVDQSFGGFPWLSDFTLVNDNFLSEAENMTLNGGYTCTVDELQRLESFLPKFMDVAREFFLPPERIRFGLVSERSLLSELNTEASDSWLVTLYSAGCPSCSKVLRESDDLKIALQTQECVVTELANDVHDLPTLPANKPSILLFVDRSSSSLNIRKASKDALDAFRELALHRQISNITHRQESIQIAKSSYETYLASSISKHPRLERFSESQKSNVKDQASVMRMNEGKQITVEKLLSDLQGSSLHEILTYLLQQKKELKLSSVAKDAGFQLLSEDFEIKATEGLSSHPGKQSDQVLELSAVGALKGTVESDDDQKLQKPGAFNSGNDAESFQQVDAKDPVDTSAQLSSVFTHSHTNEAVGYAEDRKFEEIMLTVEDQMEQQKHFTGSFFFCDGHFRLLEALTAGSQIPSVVIIDPVMQQHFILPETTNFSYSSLSDFLDGFLNGSLTPYQQSEPSVQSPREAAIPPFVNLDFHEADPIPQVTAHTFTELVLGNQSDSENAGNVWYRDVVVLFSNNWCGFCQRMELAVREVYRAIKSHAIMSKNGSRTKPNDKVASSMLKVPLIYLMDCSVNDCSLIFKSLIQREIYPSLLLFPAISKKSIAYEGDLAVSDIINFLADHGALVKEKGILRAGVKQSGSFLKIAPPPQISSHEVLLKDRMQNMAAKYEHIRVHSLTGSHETSPLVVVGSILTATDKLMDVHPFDESKILIVKADQAAGFEGLIVNKLINWDSLEEGLELLKQTPLSYGGPVMKRGMPLVALSHKFLKDQYLEILPNIYFIDQQATLKLIEELRLGNESVHGYWFFVGFSSWGWDQLFQEIAQGAWDVRKGNVEQLEWPEVL